MQYIFAIISFVILALFPATARNASNNKACVQDAFYTLPQSMPYYIYNYGRDAKLMTSIKGVKENIGIIIFSHDLSLQAEKLPSHGIYSPVLFMKSLLDQMCGSVTIKTGYDYLSHNRFYDFIIFQTE